MIRICTTLLAIVITVLSVPLCAQEKESRVKVEITKDENGEQKTFSRTYNSKAEMNADQEFQEFMGDDHKAFHYKFDNREGLRRIIELDEAYGNHYFYQLDDEAMRMLGTDSAWSSAMRLHLCKTNDELMDLDRDLKEQMQLMHEQLSISFGDEDFQWHHGYSGAHMLNIEKILDDTNGEGSRVPIMVVKGLRISNDVSEFGRKGNVNDDNRLELEQLNYYPNPAPNGKFKLKFNTPDEGELSIRIYNLDGKEVFNRYFERYFGQYSETIDLSRQSAGIYLLEINLNDKRLTRKIAIDK